MQANALSVSVFFYALFVNPSRNIPLSFMDLVDFVVIFMLNTEAKHLLVIFRLALKFKKPTKPSGIIKFS